MMRQSVACRASGDRTTALRRIAVPTLVMHGADDAMCNLSGGQAIAAFFPGAELVVFPGMGHSLPRELWPDMTARMAALVAWAEAATSWPKVRRAPSPEQRQCTEHAAAPSR
jgi:pimeloyl-ACP methyl ester carboxylesterase